MTTSTELATLDDLLAHARWTRAMAMRLLGNADEADDILQETWLSALRLPPARRGSLRPWLATVVRNLVRSRARNQARARRRVQHLAAEVESASPEQLATKLETERLIAALVLNLSEPYRRTILLRYHQGKSSAEIAAVEGIAEGTVRWRLKHGLDELRRNLEERTGGREQALRVLVPLAAVTSAATAASKGALAAAAPLLLLKGKAMVAAATVAAAVVGAGLVVERAPRLERRVAELSTRAPATPPRRAAALPSLAMRPDPPSPAPVATPALVPPDPVRPAAAAALVMPLPSAPRATSARIGSGGPSGSFTFKDLPAGRFAVTAQVPGRPGSRVVMEVDGLRAGGKVAVSITPAGGEAMSVAVTPLARGMAAAAAGQVDPTPPGHSRWCCHRAIAVGVAVEGRACLKLPSEDTAPECELYGLKRQVRCWDETEGHFATGDLSRTGRLVCEGQAL